LRFSGLLQHEDTRWTIHLASRALEVVAFDLFKILFGVLSPSMFSSLVFFRDRTQMNLFFIKRVTIRLHSASHGLTLNDELERNWKSGNLKSVLLHKTVFATKKLPKGQFA
jgi:hypothetical protein